MKRFLMALVVLVALSALFGWAEEEEFRTAREANQVRAWSVLQWEAHYLETDR